QVYSLQDAGDQLSQMRYGRVRRAQSQERTAARFLRLQPLPGMRFHYAIQADCGALPEVRRSLYCGQAHQDRARTYLLEGRLRLGNRGAGIGAEGSDSGRGRRGQAVSGARPRYEEERFLVVRTSGLLRMTN